MCSADAKMYTILASLDIMNVAFVLSSNSVSTQCTLTLEKPYFWYQKPSKMVEKTCFFSLQIRQWWIPGVKLVLTYVTQVEELYTMVLVAFLDLLNSWRCESCKYMLRVTLQKSCLDSFLIISVNFEARATSQKEQGNRQVYLYGSI